MEEQFESAPGQSFSGPVPEIVVLENQFLGGLKKAQKSLNTLKNYKTDLDCFNGFLLDAQENLKLKSINNVTINEYSHFLDQKYSSDNSKRRRIQTLRLFFDFLIDQGLFNENPVRKLVASPKFLDIPRPASFVDILKLWSYLEEWSQRPGRLESLVGKRNQLLFVLIYGSGLKVSDLVELKTQDVLLEGSPRVLIRPLKRDPYTVPLPHIASILIPRYLRELESCKNESGHTFEALFFNANPYRLLKGGLSARGIEAIFEEFRKKLDIQVTPKSLRQACVFKWLFQKFDDVLIKEWMGVAPSYSLALYKQFSEQYPYHDHFFNLQN